MTKPEQQPAEAFFALKATLKTGTPVAILRMRLRPEMLQFQIHLTFSPEHQAAVAKLTPNEAAKLINRIHLELARAKIGFTIGMLIPIGGVEQPQNTIVTLVKAVRINNGLDRERFAECVDEIDLGTSIMRATAARYLDHNEPPMAAAAPQLKQ